MIEKFVSRPVWNSVVEVMTKKHDSGELLPALTTLWKSPVSNDYIEGCAIGVISLAAALLKVQPEAVHIHWLAQKVSSNFIFVLHQRGFDPYVNNPENPEGITQADIDRAVEETLKQLQQEPPPSVK